MGEHQDREQIVRTVLGMWSSGKEATLDSWRKYAVEDLVWWNSARGEVVGLSACLEGIAGMYDHFGLSRVDVPISNIGAGPDRVFVERSDDLILPDGSALARIPVVGIVEFRGDKISGWRDYCNDWMRDLASDPDAAAPDES